MLGSRLYSGKECVWRVAGHIAEFIVILDSRRTIWPMSPPHGFRAMFHFRTYNDEFTEIDVTVPKASTVYFLDLPSGMVHFLFVAWHTPIEKHMVQKSPNLTLSLPKCGFCGRYWRPPQGMVADSGNCQKCSLERRKIASSSLGLKPITAADVTGNFLLPRRLRSH